MDASLLFGYELSYCSAAVYAKTVPDDQQVRGDVTQQSAEESDCLLAADRSRMKLKVEVPPRHPRDRREAFPREAVLEDRCLPASPPSADAIGALGDAALIDEDDGSRLARGFFLMFGQVTRFQ